VNDVDELRAAIGQQDVCAVRRLVDDSPRLVEAIDRNGLTALMFAVLHEQRSVEVVSAIIDAGARINTQSSDGYTALHCSIDVTGPARLNAENVITKLVSAGADLEVRQKYGWTPLICAVVRNRPVEVRCLLAVGAQPNATLPRDSVPAFSAGRTALMAALTAPACAEILPAMLQAGADPFQRDEDGLDFFSYANMLRSDWGEWRFSGVVDRGEAIVRAWLKHNRHPSIDARNQTVSWLQF
jgi:ankyrin repeat protein